MIPQIERQGGSENRYLRPFDGIYRDQEVLYRKMLSSAKQDLRTDLVPLVGSMSWPVQMSDIRRTFFHFSEEGHPPSLTIEAPPLTPVVAPATAVVVQVDAGDPTYRGGSNLATIKLHAPDTHMTIVLQGLVAESLPDKLRDTVQLHLAPGVLVEAGEFLGKVGREVVVFYPKQKIEVKEIRDNLLVVHMARQPLGPTQFISNLDTVDPLPFFQLLFENS